MKEIRGVQSYRSESHREEIFEIMGNHPSPATPEKKSMIKEGSWEERRSWWTEKLQVGPDQKQEPVSEQKEENIDWRCQICSVIKETGTGEKAMELMTGSVHGAGRTEGQGKMSAEEERVQKFESE